MTAAYGGLGGMAAAYPQMAAAAAASSAATTSASTSSSAAAAAAATTAAGQQQQATTAWMAMYQQLAVQEYFKQLQSAARDPAAYAALAAQGAVPSYEMLTGGSSSSSSGATGKGGKAKKSSSASTGLDSVRLPSDTEIIKYSGASASGSARYHLSVYFYI